MPNNGFPRRPSANVAAPVTLNYLYTKSGSLEAPVSADGVHVSLSTAEGGKQAHVDYLTGSRAMTLPDLQGVVANPVILYFLEQDVREMQRLSSGKSAYFRKRVRLALAESAQTAGRATRWAHIDAVEITVRPYGRIRCNAALPRMPTRPIRSPLPGTGYGVRNANDDVRPESQGCGKEPPPPIERHYFLGDRR
jgi:hypothetical protein